MADAQVEIKKLMTEKRLVIGTEATTKMVRQGKLAKVYLSSNCPDQIKEDLERYCKMAEIECQDVGVVNEELGVWCKKGYAISVLGVLKSVA